ncbi:MAG TPA: arginine deiminase-related protein [Phnomibacter sp.]|nr:arginine deiminase-related protein [Phnomibacter sp.]
MQTTNHLLMIRPVRFGFNAETAVNNAFQVADADQAKVMQQACTEFDNFVTVLRQAGVSVLVVSDTAEPHTPDSIFPNNWVSFHQDRTVVLYPMFAENRRLERKPHVLEAVQQQFSIQQTIDLSGYENQQLFLEGTGSMVLDRENRIAYACLSPRTDNGLLHEWCAKLGYRAESFWAVDEQGKEIYHTNVMMCVADTYVVICLESIPNPIEQNRVVKTIENSGKQIIPISLTQMNRFAGNMLQVQNAAGETILVMSTQAYESLTSAQVTSLEKFNPILHSPLNTIESNGGGSARCMMAEVHLPLQ